MTIFLLIRHASNDYVKEGRLAGRLPGVHINAQGQREADALARRTAHLPIEAIYSSPLERAVDTANALAACHHLPVQIREELIEGEAGEWTGKTLKELQQTETWKAIQSAPVGVPLPGGESIDQVQARMTAAAEAIAREHAHSIVALVSHADPLKSLIAHFLNWDLNQFQRIAINPASVSIVALDDGKATLLLLNHCGDLPKLEKPKLEKPPINITTEQGTLPAEPAALDDARKEEQKMPESNILYDLNPVSRITAEAQGEPGHRVFYLQARQGVVNVTLLAEKEQIVALCEGIKELLEKLGERGEPGDPVSPYDLSLQEPIEPLFRIGQLGIGYDGESERIVIVAYEAVAEEEPDTVNVVRFWCSREQMRALTEHAMAVAASGRPICVLCGRPIDPEGHFCPRRNGHGKHATLV
jgi:probable phosphomutase (TIGR03848 family)/uncharacterized repeat protein (TIGR03847 family)